MSGDGPRESIVRAADEERKRRAEGPMTAEEWADEYRPLREWVDPERGGTLPLEMRVLILKLLAEHDRLEENQRRQRGWAEVAAVREKLL